MSRMHSRDRGSSGSSKPVNENVPRWVDYDEEEVVDLVVKLSENGLDPSQIGIELRDSYGIPSVKTVTGKKVTTILDEEDAAPELPEDLKNVLAKAESIKDHVESNPKDQQSERQLELTEAKIRRLAKYHRENGNIDEDWKYSRE